jgi:hypothetical protein
MNTETENQVVRLPIWKHVLELMRQEPIIPGRQFSAEFFEENLRMKREDMSFALSISNIRQELLADGVYLDGRGGRGDKWFIRPYAENHAVMKSYTHQALMALKKGVILGTNTPLDSLTDDERKRHESVLCKMATRLALMQRRNPELKIIEKYKPAVESDRMSIEKV